MLSAVSLQGARKIGRTPLRVIIPLSPKESGHENIKDPSNLFSVVQVLGLWMVVVDHQVSLVISHLSSDKKNQLRQLLFRYLVMHSYNSL